jgi:hypothetical protein
VRLQQRSCSNAATQRSAATQLQQRTTQTIGKKKTKRTTRAAWVGSVARHAFGFFCRIPFKRYGLGYTFDDGKRTNRVSGQTTNFNTEIFTMLVVCRVFDHCGDGETRIIKMREDKQAFFGNCDCDMTHCDCDCGMMRCDCDCGFGYLIPEDEDFIINDGEYLGLHVACSLYEGGEASGSYQDFSWALLPEDEVEAAHLAKHATLKPIYR